MTHRALQLVALAAAAWMAVACGKKGNPQAPLRPVPVAVTGFSIERIGDQVTVSFKVPDANVGGISPPRIDGVEVYALTQPTGAPPPTPAELVVAAHRVALIPVRAAGQAATSATDKRPVAGEPASFVESLPAAAASTAPASRFYAAAGVVGSRRGPVPVILALPLTVPPDPPADVRADYTEKEIRVLWTPASASHRFVVEEAGAAGVGPKRLTLEPVSGPQFVTAVEFGRERCFSVRAADVTTGVVSLGASSPPRCVTPADHFAPEPVTGLVVSAGEGGVDLLWTASTSSDVAGYVVLRADGADGTLQRLTTAPITATQYRDQTARAGMTYSYAVIAIDGAKPPNESAQSDRRTVTAKRP